MEKLTLLQEMKERGMDLQKVDETDCSFMFANEWLRDNIIVEVFPGGIYHFYWTNKGMLGFLDSGPLQNIDDDEKFDYNYTLFKMQVESLRGKVLYE